MNIISDPWIPVVRGGQDDVIQPYQIAEPEVTALAWQRPDFNLACLELLIGLVFLADPPPNDEEWQERFTNPDASRLKKALAAFADYFELAGDGPRFLQDDEKFEQSAKKNDLKDVDMLFIDSAGKQTIANNSDLMVKRGRFASLPQAEAAMALYTLQAFAPAGGAGNRTSMRGGGPMCTLVQPLAEDSANISLWQQVFANVLTSKPFDPADAKRVLPWLRPTRTSNDGATVQLGNGDPEVLFGMPRRLRLIFEDDNVVGVVQKPYGTNYARCFHPLTPYYRQKEDDVNWLPVHPKPGRMSYRNWLGTVISPRSDSSSESHGTRRLALVLDRFDNCGIEDYDCEVLAGGWAMDNMKPVDFTLHRYPAFWGLDSDDCGRVEKLVDSANEAARALRSQLKVAAVDGSVYDSLCEGLYLGSQAFFEECVRDIREKDSAVEEKWLKRLRSITLREFDRTLCENFTNLSSSEIEKRVNARKTLLRKFKKIGSALLPKSNKENHS